MFLFLSTLKDGRKPFHLSFYQHFKSDATVTLPLKCHHPLIMKYCGDKRHENTNMLYVPTSDG